MWTGIMYFFCAILFYEVANFLIRQCIYFLPCHRRPPRCIPQLSQLPLYLFYSILFLKTELPLATNVFLQCHIYKDIFLNFRNRQGISSMIFNSQGLRIEEGLLSLAKARIKEET